MFELSLLYIRIVHNHWGFFSFLLNIILYFLLFFNTLCTDPEIKLWKRFRYAGGLYRPTKAWLSIKFCLKKKKIRWDQISQLIFGSEHINCWFWWVRLRSGSPQRGPLPRRCPAEHLQPVSSALRRRPCLHPFGRRTACISGWNGAAPTAGRSMLGPQLLPFRACCAHGPGLSPGARLRVWLREPRCPLHGTAARAFPPKQSCSPPRCTLSSQEWALPAPQRAESHAHPRAPPPHRLSAGHRRALVSHLKHTFKKIRWLKFVWS